MNFSLKFQSVTKFIAKCKKNFSCKRKILVVREKIDCEGKNFDRKRKILVVSEKSLIVREKFLIVREKF